jgi:hypothetical protein
MVVAGQRPTRPMNSMKLGISDEMWQLLECCWNADRLTRPGVTKVRNFLQEAIPTWTPLPPDDPSWDVQDDESEIVWTTTSETLGAEFRLNAQLGVSDLNSMPRVDTKSAQDTSGSSHTPRDDTTTSDISRPQPVTGTETEVYETINRASSPFIRQSSPGSSTVSSLLHSNTQLLTSTVS